MKSEGKMRFPLRQIVLSASEQAEGRGDSQKKLGTRDEVNIRNI